MSGPAAVRDRPAEGSATRRPAYVCGWCGRTFREDRAQPACRACPLTRLCGQVRCPACGWENPARPGWRAREEAASGRGGGGGALRRLLARLARIVGRGRGSP